MPAGALLVTARDGLAASVGRLAALAGTSCAVESDSAAVRGAWRQASMVLVGGDVAVALASAGLPRRGRVLVVTEGQPDAVAWQAALALGAHRVVALPDDESGLVEELRAADHPAGTDARVLGVVGGCGGAGVSTFAAALALAASTSSPTVLLDGDPLGGGLDVLLGAEAAPGLRWGELAGTRGRLDPESFAGALCRVGSTAVLAWGRDARGPYPMQAVDAVLDAAKQAFAVVVLDLPRSWGPVADRMLDGVDATVLLVPAEVRAVSATSSLLGALGSRVLAPQLVVRDAGSGSLTAREVGASLGLDVVATLRSDPSVRLAARRGDPPIRGSRGALARACGSVLSAISAVSGSG
jgi:secretion/DNA translocation related CpaE-like protein